MTKGTIHVTHIGLCGSESGGTQGIAVDDEGQIISTHFCSSIQWVKTDMGVPGETNFSYLGNDYILEKAEESPHYVKYLERYPDGFKIRWHETPSTLPDGSQNAINIYKEERWGIEPPELQIVLNLTPEEITSYYHGDARGGVTTLHEKLNKAVSAAHKEIFGV